MAGGARICDPGGGGWFLPITQREQHWGEGIRGVMYALGMVYFFLGISIVADLFMGSIEAVTSRKRKRQLKSGRRVTEKVWNDTVATLSLMALGSSAPEIFFAVIELFKKEYHSGDLGPSTIIGSASFNLFVIVGVCILVIPAGESRQIHELPAFFVTAAFSMGAYMWIVFILLVHSPDIVDIWEAVATFLGLPALIWTSYSIDVGTLHRLLVQYTSNGVAEEAELSEDEGQMMLSFASEHKRVKRQPEKVVLEVTARRAGGDLGAVSCGYRTEAFTAVAGYDYVETSGTLEFAEGVSRQSLKLEILPQGFNKISREFFVVMEGATGGAAFDPDEDGGEDSAILTVTIDAPAPVDRWGRLQQQLDAAINVDSLRAGTAEWAEQLQSWVYCNGSREEHKQATRRERFLHILTLPWKMIFSLVPPAGYFGGWVCFCVAITLIGLLTAVVSDLAELFGCVLDIPDIVTAVTFVALGTSMPDLFASLTSAQQDPTADASIVNVTGSNSVNVFLGLGLPWSIASIYWSYLRRTEDWASAYPEVAAARADGHAAFVVASRNLGFQVLVFCGVSTLALLVLATRRKCLHCELGGPYASKVAAAVAFFVFWCVFVTLTSWRVLACGDQSVCQAPAGEQLAVQGAACAVLVAATAVAMVLSYVQGKPRTREVDLITGKSPTVEDASCDGNGAKAKAVAEDMPHSWFQDVAMEQSPYIDAHYKPCGVTQDRGSLAFKAKLVKHSQL